MQLPWGDIENTREWTLSNGITLAKKPTTPVIIFAAGTGNPYFTTDTAAALRASEISADVIFKATKVDGVYTDDPKKNKKAKKYNTIKYADILAKNLKIMDGSAIALARDNNIPIIVFSISKKNAFLDAIFNKGEYTIIK